MNIKVKAVEAHEKLTPRAVMMTNVSSDGECRIGDAIAKGTPYVVTSKGSISNNFGFVIEVATIRGTRQAVISGYDSQAEAEQEGWDFSPER